MKIIFSNYDDLKNPYYRGGGAIGIHEVAKRLAKNNKVTVLTGKYPNSINIKIDNVQYKRIGLSIGPKFGQIAYHFFLPFYVLTEKFDIWIESFTPPFSTSFLPLFTKNPVVGLAQFFNAEEKSKEYKVPFYIIQNFGIKFYKYCIALTDGSKEKILKLNSNIKISIIPNGVNIPKNLDRKNDNYILYLGRIEIKQKGLDLLINAFKKIENKTNTSLYIAGDGPKKEVEHLKKLIQKNKLQKRINLLGRVEGETKDHALRKTKFLVIPSLFETQSLVALEAIAYNKPTVVFDIVGLNWIPEGASLKVPSFSVNKYAASILELLENKKLYQNMTNKTLKFANNYSWDKSAKKYEKLINDVFKKNNEKHN